MRIANKAEEDKRPNKVTKTKTILKLFSGNTGSLTIVRGNFLNRFMSRIKTIGDIFQVGNGFDYWFWSLIFIVLIFGVLLALLPGGALYSPKERSLRRGKRYGTDTKPRVSKEVPQLPQESTQCQLPPPNKGAGT